MRIGWNRQILCNFNTFGITCGVNLGWGKILFIGKCPMPQWHPHLAVSPFAVILGGKKKTKTNLPPFPGLGYGKTRWGEGFLENICTGMLKVDFRMTISIPVYWKKKKKHPITIPQVWLNQPISLPFLLNDDPLLSLLSAKQPIVIPSQK